LNYIHKIDVSARNLLRIINDILDFSKIEAGKLSLEKTNIFLDELINELTDNVNVKLSTKKDVELITQIDQNIPALLPGDSVRVRQILLNLMDNAVKFTDEGEVKLIVSLKEKVDNNYRILFKIEDTGIGMTEDQVK